METEKYNDDMIEKMLEKSAVDSPEDITANIIASLPSIHRGKYGKRSLWARKKWMITALTAIIIIVLLTILMAMTTLRLITSRAKKLLNSEPHQTEEASQ